MEYAVIPLVSATITGAIGRYKGSSFFIWFLIGGVLPVFGILIALVSRTERHDPKRECPNCGNVVGIAVQVCPRCGEDLDYPDEFVAPRGYEFVDPEEPDDEEQPAASTT